MQKREIKRVIITGITGSGGSYLAEYLVNQRPQVEVHGISRWHSTTSAHNLKEFADKVSVHECDLLDLSSILRVLKEVRPDGIFHLAAHANVRACFDTPLSVIQNNIMGTANLLEAIRLSDCDPTLMMCSTSEVYGRVEADEVPIKESCQIAPASPYAVSKVTQDLLSHVYHFNQGTKTIRTRMFSYFNPRRGDLFSTSFAMQVARIEAGLQDELTHGNLQSVRTMIDVRDAMESYWLVMTEGELGEVYNLGGTTSISVGEFLDVLKKKAKTEIPSRVDEKLLRPTDVTLQIPDTSRFVSLTGWKPKYTFEESVEHLLNHCRKVAAREKALQTVNIPSNKTESIEKTIS